MSLGVSGYSASIGPSATSNNKHFMNKKVSSPKPPPYYTSKTNQKKVSNNREINIRDREEEMDKV